MDNELIEKVKTHVRGLFQDRYDQRSSYHSFEHTTEVATAAEKIGKASDLNNDELEAAIIAGWFHDTGYLFGNDSHEEASVKVATDFLQQEGYPEMKLKRVADCILATRMNYVPVSLMEEVIHDADYINLANSDNLKQSALLKREAVNYGASEPTEEEWLREELKFLINHRYYTAYGKKKLEDKKADNIKRIKKKLKKYRETETLIQNIPMASEKNQNKEKEKELEKEREKEKEKEKEREKEKEKDNDKDKDKDKDDEPNKAQLEEQKAMDKKEATSVKGFEAIYKLSSTNHMRLNAIADRKANIMLTLNGIIISITLSIVAAESETNPRLIIPTSILIIVCLVTIIFATLSTRPKITSGTIEKRDIEDKKANLLFFGNFSRMNFEDFDWGIRKMIRDQDYLHNSMILDFYNLGKVLDLKFRYLRICYNVFMYGLVLTVLSLTFLIFAGY